MKYLVLISLVLLISCDQNSTHNKLESIKDTFADNWKYVGVAVAEPVYNILGGESTGSYVLKLIDDQMC